MSNDAEVPKGDRSSAVLELVRVGLEAGSPFSAEVTSCSMSPLICLGDRVNMRKVDSRALQPGDIVALALPGEGPVTHRYIGVLGRDGEERLVTKGDRSLISDPPWPNEALVGRVETIHRKKKQLTIYRGLGGGFHRVLGALALWEWRWLNRLPKGLARRGFHRAVGYVARPIAGLAWLTALGAML